MTDVVSLAQALVRLDTAGHGEQVAAELCAEILLRAGARVEFAELAPGRASMVASVGDPSSCSLVLSGHLDTVPANAGEWSCDPRGAQVREGILRGCGAADMKAGVAALVVALERHLVETRPRRCVALVLTAGEETGCEGARQLAARGLLPTCGPLLVAEPTANRVATGHKGALWLTVRSEGRAAHGSRPDLGHNAIAPLARLAIQLEEDGLPGNHPVMGDTTVNVGMLHGGSRLNIVPDRAEMGVDIRTVPGVSHHDLLARIRQMGDERLTIDVELDLPPVYAEPGGPLYGIAGRLLERMTGAASAREPLTYFTDASVLADVLHSNEILILGPGDPASAHTSDEGCPIVHIEQALVAYGEILRHWDAIAQPVEPSIDSEQTDRPETA